MIDLRGGRALHARAGKREDYVPVRGILGDGEDPLGLAISFQAILGLNEVYIADLDAISGGLPNLTFLRALAEAGIKTRVDAGITTAQDRSRLQDAGATFIVAATETLPGPRSLIEIIGSEPSQQFILSLDLRDGRPIVPARSGWTSTDTLGLAREAASVGISRFLLLETARMGTGRGFGHSPLVREFRCRFPTAEISVGGGVSGIEDVQELVKQGVSRVLIGSALHDGRIDRDALRDLDFQENRGDSSDRTHSEIAD